MVVKYRKLRINKHPGPVDNQVNSITVIDDLDASLSRLSVVGRRLMTPIVMKLRDVLLNHAMSRHWYVASYKAFIDSVYRTPKDNQLWVVLDKLFPIEAIREKAVVVDLHRSWSSSLKGRLDSKLTYQFDDPLNVIKPGTIITLLDDAAYTGSTIRTVLQQIRKHGGEVRQIIIFVTRPAVIYECRKIGVSVSWQFSISSPHDILHMRDFFPWSPFWPPYL